MVLLRSQGNGNVFEQDTAPTGPQNGDLWYDTANNRLNLNINGTFRIIIPSSLTTGDLLSYNGTNFVRLAVGTSTQVVKGGTNPSYGAGTTIPAIIASG